MAARLGVPPEVIGFTLVAVGTSLPELVTAIQAQRHGEPDLLVGNLLGSNLFNSLAVGAVIGLAGAGSGTTVVPAAQVVVMVGASLERGCCWSTRHAWTAGRPGCCWSATPPPSH